MSERIFIELYLDEDVSVLVAELIRARGFSAITTVEAGNLGKSDLEQLSFATEQQKVFITHNRVDFEKLAVDYFEQGQRHAGIIVAVRRHSAQIASRLLAILGSTTCDEMVNQLRYI